MSDDLTPPPPTDDDYYDPELLDEHREDDALFMQMATEILNDKCAEFIPFGLREKVQRRLRRGTPAIAKAEGRDA